MRCQEFVELVTAYLEGALPDDQRVAFEEHLELCPGCEHYLAQFRRTIELLGELPEEALSAPGRQRLLDAFAGWRGDSVIWPRGGPGRNVDGPRSGLDCG